MAGGRISSASSRRDELIAQSKAETGETRDCLAKGARKTMRGQRGRAVSLPGRWSFAAAGVGRAVRCGCEPGGALAHPAPAAPRLHRAPSADHAQALRPASLLPTASALPPPLPLSPTEPAASHSATHSTRLAAATPPAPTPARSSTPSPLAQSARCLRNRESLYPPSTPTRPAARAGQRSHRLAATPRLSKHRAGAHAHTTVPGQPQAGPLSSGYWYDGVLIAFARPRVVAIARRLAASRPAVPLSASSVSSRFPRLAPTLPVPPRHSGSRLHLSFTSRPWQQKARTSTSTRSLTGSSRVRHSPSLPKRRASNLSPPVSRESA